MTVRSIVALAITLSVLTVLHWLYLSTITWGIVPRPLHVRDSRNSALPTDPLTTLSPLWALTPIPREPQSHDDNGHHRAFLTIISNDLYVDGALTWAYSLHQHSALVSSGKCHVVLLATNGRVSTINQQRLHRYFHKLIEVQSLALRAPRAFWKDTFDKIYMFNLTQYRRVVFMDADMLVVGNPDALFDKQARSKDLVGAIGSKHSDDPYFQTGMMVFSPGKALFQKIWEEFESGVPPRGNKYNHGMGSRDGVLLRTVIMPNFYIIDNRFSRNLDPRKKITKNIVGLHFRGTHKPWYSTSRELNSYLGKKEFGHSFAAWWVAYEALHRDMEILNRSSTGLPYGGKAQRPGVGPDTHAWLMRGTEEEYLKPLDSTDRREREVHSLDFTTVLGKPGQSCDLACSSEKMTCVERWLASSNLQNCTFLKQLSGCDICEIGVYWKQHRGDDYPAFLASTEFNEKNVCRFNFLKDSRTNPLCNASHASSNRFCPCQRYL